LETIFISHQKVEVIRTQGLAFILRLSTPGVQRQEMKQSVTQLSKRARAVIQIAGAILLVFGIEAITNGALFRAGLLLPLGGFLFGRSLST
jgi:hypothetical protein